MTVTVPIKESSLLSSPPRNSSSRFKVIFPFSPYPSVTYNHISYEKPQKTDSSIKSLWRSSDLSAVYRSIGGSYDFIVWNHLASFGGKYYLYKNYNSDSYFDDNLDNGALTYLKGTAANIWIDYSYLNFSSSSINFHVGNGIELSRSLVSFNSTLVNDLDKNINQVLASSKSELILSSFRTSISSDISWNRVGVGSSILLTMPLFGENKDSVNIVTPHKNLYTETQNEPIIDLRNSLDHHAANFGIDLELSIFLNL
jgi:hypothetical protein